MGTPFDVAAGAAGLASLSFAAFHGCVKGFQLIKTAQSMGEDADRIRILLEWEQYRLIEWATRAGLHAGGVQNPKLNWTVILDILKQLELLLSDAEILKREFNLVEDSGPSRSPLPSKERRGVCRLWTYVSPQMRTERARLIQESTSVYKKLRWSVLDQEKIKVLIDHISRFNTCLHQSLETTDQDFFKNALAALLHDLVSRTTSSTDLDLIKALLDSNYVAEASSIDAATNLKKLRLRLRVDQRPDELSSGQNVSTQNHSEAGKKGRLPKLSYDALTLMDDSKDPGEGNRQLGRYRSPRKNIDAEVLVEWKTVEKSLESKLIYRIQELTFLMCNISDPSFHSLPCLGYLCKENEGSFSEYAYIFEIAPQSVLSQQRPRISTLTSSLMSSFRPSLSYRTEIAHALAETVKQLHTSGWLHKGIRSENVIFIDRGNQNGESPRGSRPFLAGYEYARADNPLEITEDTPMTSEQSLYRHPESQGHLRSFYRKDFDLFALGCVLLEVALWKRLEQILFDAGQQPPTANAGSTQGIPGHSEQQRLRWDTILRGKSLLLDKAKVEVMLDKVAFHTGDIFRSAVQLCFFPEADEIADEDRETTVRPQVEIASMLSERKV